MKSDLDADGSKIIPQGCYIVKSELFLMQFGRLILAPYTEMSDQKDETGGD